ncbi:hypothetical protein AOG23_34520 [Rhizobium acidisoli]|nr:hypothetical protein AOG23_34520 [Rhizobium acidisoli]
MPIRLRKMLDKLRWKRKQPPLPYSGSADIVWVEPTLIAEIEFRAWTTDGKLRHPPYQACENDRTMPTSSSSTSEIGAIR